MEPAGELGVGWSAGRLVGGAVGRWGGAVEPEQTWHLAAGLRTDRRREPRGAASLHVARLVLRSERTNNERLGAPARESFATAGQGCSRAPPRPTESDSTLRNPRFVDERLPKVAVANNTLADRCPCNPPSGVGH